MVKGWVILLVAVFYCCGSNAQSLRGKLIYVSASQPVKLKFGSRISNYSFIERGQAALFNIRYSGKKNLSISSNAVNFRTANLVVSEGSNTHLFILHFKQMLDAPKEDEYDFSSADKLNEEIQKVRMVLNDPSAREAFSKQPTSVPDFAAKVETPVTRPEPPVTKPEPQATQTSVATTSGPKVNYTPKTNNTSTPAVNNTSTNTSTNTATLKVKTPEPKKTTTPPPTAKPMPVEITEAIPVSTYDVLIHLGDSAAWIAKNYKAAIDWYDSAQKINPTSTYPRKQIAAVKQIMNEKLLTARKERSAKFQLALPAYWSADALRVDRKFEEAYRGYSKFLSQVDTANVKEYLSSEQYYIKQASDYVSRLEPYLPKPKPQAAPAPTNDKGKKKKRKKNA